MRYTSIPEGEVGWRDDADFPDQFRNKRHYIPQEKANGGEPSQSYKRPCRIYVESDSFYYRRLLVIEQDWIGGRNSYLAPWGEYEPCSGWVFAARFNQAFRAELHINERRGRASSFTLKLSYGSTTHVVASEKCRTIRQAKKRSIELLRDPVEIEKLWKKAFSQDGASTIYVKSGETYVPFCSLPACYSGWFLGCSTLNFPRGDYMKVDHQGNLKSIKQHGCFESCGTPTDKELEMFHRSPYLMKEYE